MRRSAPCSHPLFWFRRQPWVGPGDPVSYLGMTSAPERESATVRQVPLVRAVKSRHSPYAAKLRPKGIWHVLMARTVG
ncbi:hypothetical protein E4K73_21860 [Streptomyces sp. IB201691-2A2]|nr:hypothetical protein E4K73_21860 [Streptomyces sp. IB201691-2A2]